MISAAPIFSAEFYADSEPIGRIGRAEEIAGGTEVSHRHVAVLDSSFGL
jgi:hypothetical protein